MSAQHDMNIANADAAAVRADINLALVALASNSWGTTEPGTTFAHQFWADTAASQLKMRNAANNAWIVLGDLGAVGLGLLSRAGGSMTGLLNMKAGADIASAATLNLSTATGNLVHVTGTTATSAVTMNAGQWALCIADAAWPLTYHATTNKISGGASLTLAAGDTVLYTSDGTTVRGVIFRANGNAVGGAENIATAAEVLTGTDNAKMVTALAAQALALVSGTAQATTSGTAINFASIPAGTKRITISLAGQSTNGTSRTLIQLGDAGGFETTGYIGTHSSGANLSDGFIVVNVPGTGTVVHGQMVLTLLDAATNTWACQGMFGLSDSASLHYSGGSKALSGELTQIRLTTSGGVNTFDAGLMNILYER